MNYSMTRSRPDRSKAEFKALREMVGYSQNDLAAALEVKQLSVVRWESPAYEQLAPLEAWQLLDDAAILQKQIVTFALAKVEEIEQRLGREPDAVELPYYSSAEDYAEHGQYAGDGSGWKRANANARATFSALSALDYQVKWVSGAENKVKDAILD